MKTSLRLVAASVVGAIALTTGAGAAGASVSASARRNPMEVVRTKCNNQITFRSIVLHDLAQRINHAQRLSPEQKEPMVASINETINVLETVYRPAVNNATTREALAEACKAIFVDLRIFAVYVPQTRFTAMVDALTNWKENLAVKVQAAHDAGEDTAELEALLASAGSKIEEATTKITSVSPDSFNADPEGTREIWASVHDGLKSAFVDLLHVHQGVTPPAG